MCNKRLVGCSRSDSRSIVVALDHLSAPLWRGKEGYTVPEWHGFIIVLDHARLLPLQIENTAGIWLYLPDVFRHSFRMGFRGVFARQDSFYGIHREVLVLGPLGLEYRARRKAQGLGKLQLNGLKSNPCGLRCFL